MRCSGWFCFCALAVLICCGLGVTYRGHAEEPAAKTEAKSADATKVTVAVARDRARLLHDVYTSTLEVMHERYFHGQRATVPARALEDVFADLSRKSQVEARWIAVNTKAMSLNHEPKSEFERRAAAELAKGKEEFELIKDGNYRRAAPIELHAECVSCHTAFFTQPPKTPRYAGLIISMPVESK